MSRSVGVSCSGGYTFCGVDSGWERDKNIKIKLNRRALLIQKACYDCTTVTQELL